MTMDPSEIYAGLAECRDQPPGRARSARTEELVSLAEASDRRELLVYALLELVEAYYLSTESAKAFVPFARLLRLYDEDASSFGMMDTHSLFWSFKWMSSGMKDHPEVSLAQIEGVLADMRHRYASAGYSLNAVHTSEFSIAWRTGDEERAAAAYDRWLASEPDDMSHCEACGPSLQAEWLVEHGRDAEAVELLRIVTTGDLTCGDEPENALATSLLPLARLGELDEARTNHIRGYRLVRGEATDQKRVGLHVEFCALTGNVERGLTLWAENAALLDATDEPAAHLHLLRGLLTLLEQSHATLGPDRTVAGRGGASTTVGALRTEVTADAYAIAARFDARNGTDRYRWLVDESIRAKPVVDRLSFVTPRSGGGPGGGFDDLGAAAPPDALGGGTPGFGAASSAGDEAGTPVAAPCPAPTVAAGAPLADHAARAMTLMQARHPAEAAAWRAVVAAADREPPDDPYLAAVVAYAGGLRLAASGEHAAAAQAIAAAAGAFERAGDGALAARAYADAADSATYAGDDGRPFADRAASLADPLDDDALTALVLACRGHAVAEAAAREGDDEGAVSGRDDMATACADATSRADWSAAAHFGTQLTVLRARGLGAPDADGVSCGRAAVADADRSDTPWLGLPARWALARALMAAGDHDEAEPVLAHALELARVYDDRVAFAHVAEALADVAGATDRPAVAAHHALQAARAFEAAEDTAGSLRCYVDLVGHYLELDRPAEAAELAEQLTSPAAEAGHAVEYRIRRLLGDALAGVDDPAGAAAQHIAAARIAEAHDERWAAADSAFAAGEALDEAGRTADAADAFTRAADHDDAIGATVGLAHALRRAAASHVRGDAADRAARSLERARSALVAALEHADAAGDKGSLSADGDHEVDADGRVGADESVADVDRVEGEEVDEGVERRELQAALCFELGEVDDMSARLLADAGDFAGAAATAGQAADWHTRSGSWAGESMAAALAAYLLADRLERPSEAEAWARRAVAVVPPAGDPGVDTLLRAVRAEEAYCQLARVLDALGRSDEADQARAAMAAAVDDLGGDLGADLDDEAGGG